MDNNSEPISPSIQKTLDQHQTASQKLDADDFYKIFEVFPSEDEKKLAIFQFENYGRVDIPYKDKVFRVQIGENENNEEIVTFQDITELAKQAKTDLATGLLNRNAYEERIHAIRRELSLDIKDKRKIPISMGLILIDVNGLKKVNGTLGHRYGDLLLLSVATLLKTGFREKDLAARIGGDEFALFLPDLFNTHGENANNELVEVTNRLDSNKKTIRELLQIEYQNNPEKLQQVIHGIKDEFLDNVPSFAIGGGILNSTTTDDGKKFDEVVSQIDQLMYEDKNKKKNLSTPPGFNN